MYDMYPWDVRADGPRTRPAAPRTGDDTRTSPDLATQAVQVALDRRDNGGDSSDHDAGLLDVADARASRGRK